MTKAFRPEDFKGRPQSPRMRLPKLSKRELMDAIKEGVREGIFDIATNASSTPCRDLNDAIESGVALGIERLQRQIPPAAE